MRRATAVVLGTVFLASLLSASVPRPTTAQEPAKKTETAKPQWQRYLQGDDAKKAAEQEKEQAELQKAGRFAEALKIAEELAAFREKTQGADHWQAGNARFQVDALRRVLKATKEEQQSFSRILVLNRQAEALVARRRYREVAPLLEQILAICRKVLGEEHPLTATNYHNLAYILDIQDKYEEADRNYRQALANWRKALGEEHPDVATCYNNLAYMLNTQGKYKEAEEGWRKALVIRRKLLGEEHPDTVVCYNNVAFNLHAQGRNKEAEEIYRQALAIFRKVLGEEHPLTARCYNNLAASQKSQRKYAQAEEGYLKALAVRRKRLGEENPETATSYNNLAANLHAQGRYKEAEEGFRKALSISQKVLGEDHPETAQRYHNLAANHNAQGKYKDAEEGARKALAIRQKVLGQEHPATAQSYSSLAHNLYAQGKYKEAETFLLRADKSFAKARLHVAATGLERTTFTSEHSPLPPLAAVLARNGKPDEAWQRFEESLARGTWDDLSARMRRPQTERDKQRQITARIDRLNQLIAKFDATKPTEEQSKRRDEFLSQLRQVYDELADFTRQLEQRYGPIAGEIFSRVQIQASLSPDAALIAWLDIPGEPKAADPNGEHWAILLRSTGDPIWGRLPGSGDKSVWTDADTKLPGRLRTALQTSGSDWQPLAERLRKQRLDPLVPNLKGVRKLIVLPSTALAGMPLEVISEGYTVSYAHSGTMYAHLLRQPALTSKGLFVLADPVFDRAAEKDKPQPFHGSGEGKWERLPGTRIEAASLQRLVDKEVPVQLLLDSDASEQRLNDLAQRGDLGKYRYIHLATHGEVNDAFPLRSAVILSCDHLPDEKQRTELLLSGQAIPDGRLEAEEALQRWNLHCELVTLSACQTALGKYERGEGYVGFAQALILCGTRSVCLSLWKVDDTATALLMERFYQNLLGKREGLNAPMPKASALAEAKAWLRNLPRQEAIARAASVVQGGSRAKGAAKLAPLPVPADVAKTKADERPFAHPYYWAAFVLVGHTD